MGDSVNLASRLEGANKPFHTHIMISEFTYERVKDDVEARQLDLLRVKGKVIPIRVFELVARKGELAPDQTKAFALYNEGLSLYRERKFDRALENFRNVQKILPNDGPSDVYIGRSKGYIATPPPKDWDGVFVMTTK
jgi:adenylate cyclase